MNIVLCCFASQRYWSEKEDLNNAFEQIKEELNGIYTNSLLIDDEFNLDEIVENKSDIMIAIPMSGAVQPNIIKAAKCFGNVLMYAGYIKGSFKNDVSNKMLINNAAPAVMDVYAVLKREIKNISLSVSCDELKGRVNAICAVEKIKGCKLLAIGNTEPWVISSVKDVDIIKERFGIEIIQVEQSELAEIYESITTEDAKKYDEEWTCGADDIIEPTTSDITNASRFQLALIKIIEKYNASGAALACFNLLKTGTTSCLGVSYINTYTDYVVSCEGDIDSAITMLIMKLLAKDSVWMANPNIHPDGTVNFVHCTAPIKVNDKNCRYILRNHHESGIGVSTQVELPENLDMTACRISNNLSQMTIHNCSGTHGEYEPSCRTQLKIKFDSFDKYIKNVLGCHQIFVFGDITRELTYVAEILGIEVL